MAVPRASDTLFAERLTPSPLAWLLAPGVGVIVFIMFFPVSTGTALAAAAGASVLAGAALWSLAAVVRVEGSHLVVGRARIEIDSLGQIRACSAAEMSHLMGPGSDARSYVLTRPWVRGGVYVEQIDPRDPTPYWLFSTRRPEALVAALGSSRIGD